MIQITKSTKDAEDRRMKYAYHLKAGYVEEPAKPMSELESIYPFEQLQVMESFWPDINKVEIQTVRNACSRVNSYHTHKRFTTIKYSDGRVEVARIA